MTDAHLPSRRAHRHRLPAVLAALLVVASPVARAAVAPDTRACEVAIGATEAASRLPPRMLSAIAMVESGRTDPTTGYAGPWPWTINVAGVGQTFDTREAAIAAVRAAQRAGTQSIDVGCMQVNLFFHPTAFATLEEAFEPAANVRYAARFLEALHAQAGDWATAVAYYHSATPELGTPYAQRVAAGWPQAERYGLSAGMMTKALAAASLAAEVDPNQMLTPEFRARMIEAAAFRHQQEATLGSASVKGAGSSRATAQAARPTDRTRSPTIAALEAEVDPKRTLTPEFRARLVAAAAERHRQVQVVQAGVPATPSRTVAATGVSRIASAR